MSPRTIKVICICVSIFAGLYLIAYGIACSSQAKLIFQNVKLPPDYRYEQDGSSEINLVTSDRETINALYYDKKSTRVIVYFHGNSGNCARWQSVARNLSERYAVNVLLIDYREYGKSTGTLSEKGLYYDADAAYEYCISRGFTGKNIVVYGRSIGTAIAVDLAARKSIGALVLESPFSNMRTLAREKIPSLSPGFKFEFQFDSIDKIDKINAPILIFHGTEDTLIPISHSRALYEKTGKRAQLVEIQGAGHNDISGFLQYEKNLGIFLKR
jgi:fermentation-respiration switch protein FrsA (DUF1100 family)